MLRRFFSNVQNQLINQICVQIIASVLCSGRCLQANVQSSNSIWTVDIQLGNTLSMLRTFLSGKDEKFSSNIDSKSGICNSSAMLRTLDYRSWSTLWIIDFQNSISAIHRSYSVIYFRLKDAQDFFWQKILIHSITNLNSITAILRILFRLIF